MLGREALIDRIYEAAVIAELWPNLLDEIANVGECLGGILIAATAGTDVVRWTSSESAHEIMSSFLAEPRFRENNIRLKTGIKLKHQGFLSNDLMYDREIMDRSLVYREFYYPRGLGWCAGSAIPLPNGDMVAFSLERRFKDGPVPAGALAWLNLLFPHLGRAAAISTRLNLERAHEIVDAFAAAGLPAAALGGNRKVLATNQLLEGMASQIIPLAHSQIALTDRRAQSLFLQAIDQLNDSGATRSIPIPATIENTAAVLHVIPLARRATDVFAGARALLVVTRLDRPASPTAELLTGLFDLTASEAKVARGVSEGRSVDEIATALGLSRETVRFYLKGVFAKTGVSRQIDLVALLSSTALPNAG